MANAAVFHGLDVEVLVRTLSGREIFKGFLSAEKTCEDVMGSVADNNEDMPFLLQVRPIFVQKVVCPWNLFVIVGLTFSQELSFGDEVALAKSTIGTYLNGRNAKVD